MKSLIAICLLTGFLVGFFSANLICVWNTNTSVFKIGTLYALQVDHRNYWHNQSLFWMRNYFDISKRLILEGK